MKRLLILLVLAISLLTSNFVYSSGNGVSQEREVELKSTRRPKPTKSLSSVPDIRAYVKNDCLSIAFNEAIPENISISIRENGGEVICSETIQVDFPMEWVIFIDLDESSFYELEIVTRDWCFYGGF